MSRVQAIPAQKLSFRWTSSYMGWTEYEVFGDGPSYRLEVRQEAGAYERSIFNGTEEDWQRDVVPTINVLRRKHYITQPLDQHVIEAFNAWRASDHQARLGEILAQPERYGELPENDPLRVPPPIVRGGHYETGKGWIIQDLAAAESDAELGPSP